MKKILALVMAVFMIASMSTLVFADPSAENKKEYTVEIVYEIPEDIPKEIITVKKGDNATITVKAVSGYDFDKIVIDGQYETVSWDENNKVLVITPKEDLVVHIHFKGASRPERPTDDSHTSPHTGDNTLLVLAVMMFGLCGTVIASKKLIREH